MGENKGVYETIMDRLNKIQYSYMMGYYETIKNNTTEYCRHGKMLTVFCYAKNLRFLNRISHMIPVLQKYVHRYVQTKIWKYLYQQVHRRSWGQDSREFLFSSLHFPIFSIFTHNEFKLLGILKVYYRNYLREIKSWL